MLANNLRNAQHSDGPQKKSKKINYPAMHICDLDDESKYKGESKEKYETAKHTNCSFRAKRIMMKKDATFL